jgi:Carboxypeptidase regulatory-like domain
MTFSNISSCRHTLSVLYMGAFRHSNLRLIGAILIGFLGVGPSSSGQTMGTGRMTGTVTDPSGAAVIGALVVAKNLATAAERTVQTNDHGVYVIPALQIGSYEIRVTAGGFKTSTQKNVYLDADTTVTVNVPLELGSAQQSVVVTETPPAIQTENGEMATLATGAQVNELAFNGRNFSQIITLGTGVSSTNTGHRMGVGQEGNPLISVNGGRVNSTRFTFDGVIAMDTGGNRGINLFPPLDAIDEVQIKTSNYSADSGSFGYGLVNVVTKAGGASFHGDLYEILGNDTVNARNFFDNQRAPFHQNIFGFTLGGPVYKNKTFFFVSEGWNRRKGPQLVNFTSPAQSTFTAETVDAAMRTGNFSELSTTIKNPATNLPFQGNQIPASLIDPNALALLNRFYPLPNRSGNPNFVTTPDSGTFWREDLYRVDHSFTQNILLTLRGSVANR